MNIDINPIESTFDRYVASAAYPSEQDKQLLWSLEAAKRMLLQARVQNFSGSDVVRVAAELRLIRS